MLGNRESLTWGLYTYWKLTWKVKGEERGWIRTHSPGLARSSNLTARKPVTYMTVFTDYRWYQGEAKGCES